MQPTAVAVMSTSLSSDAGAVVWACECACGYALILELACWGAECIDAVWACERACMGCQVQCCARCCLGM